MRKLTLACLLSVAAGFVAAPAASLAADPGFNFAPRPSCAGAAACQTQAIRFLNEARAKLGQPPYALPRNFADLNPARQAFVLTNLDRVMYGLRPVAGLASDLDQAAVAGLRSGTDPLPAASDYLTLTSNWAGGYLNMAFAYESWMYADGPGSNNLDCTLRNRSGCWDHRNNILWEFGGSGPLAMGAAAGIGPGGTLGYTALLVQGAPGYVPAYTYTWREALAAGAGQPTVQWHPSRRGVISCARRRTRRHHRRRRSARCGR